MALWRPKSWDVKLGSAFMVVLVFVGTPPVLLLMLSSYAEYLQRQESEARRARGAVLGVSCQKAGFKIYRTVEDVEGVFLMDLRLRNPNKGDSYKLTDLVDQSGRDYLYYGEYVESYLWGRDQQNELIDYYGDNPIIASAGYLYVELMHPQTNERIRYEGRMLAGKRESWETTPCAPTAPAGEKEHYPTNLRVFFGTCPIPLSEPGPRYGVAFSVISTREEHKHQVVGASLRVIDLETGEVMAERISYNAKGSFARSILYDFCPFRNTLPSRNAAEKQVRDFVEQVLKPKQYPTDPGERDKHE